MNTINKEIQSKMTPEEALQRLLEGNKRFVNGAMTTKDYAVQVQETAEGQFPYAAVLGCIDSRVPPEIIFDQGIGDIFDARVAGNIVNKDILGSLEFACKVIGSKLIFVLGHTACGAVTSAIDGVELGNITYMLGHIKPAVLAVDNPEEHVDLVAEKNVELSMENIRKSSPILADMERAGEIMIGGGIYDVATGKVKLLG